MNIQWYPGHMTKALRQMKEEMKLIDLVIELVDARVPISSRNPDIDKLAENKSRIVILNKSDLADKSIQKAWYEFFEKQNIICIPLDARNNKGMGALKDKCREACKEKIERDLRRGIKNRPVRAMVVGIPNVGKSTFINSFAGKASAKTGNKPGVTKGEQWIRIDKQLELLDTPGILWPKFEDQKVGMNLALIGSINDEILSREEMAYELIDFLKSNYPDALPKKYEADDMEDIAKRLGCLSKGGELDYERCAKLLLDDFRAGRLGNISLEKPEEKE